jgi:NAD(P)-dependent dehydrogenase (short-subunit alcohol dehydrogenase family)
MHSQEGDQGRPLAGQRAVVVGGGSGIGLGSARLLARDGAFVTLAGRTESKLHEAAGDLAAEGLQVGYVTCDANRPEQVRDAVTEASGPDGRIDIAVVVPGGGTMRPVLLYDDDEFITQVVGNIAPVYFFLKYAGQAMLRNGSGSFVAISSTAAAFSARFLASYCTGKAGVDHLVRVAADELGEYGIRVNSVRPGLTETPATAGTFAYADLLSDFLDGQPLRRRGQVEDVAQAVRYLAGPESSWVTGQTLAVDGGHTLRSFVDYRRRLKVPDPRAVVLGETEG